ncbi:MAG: right-handed parallel beta-helix repeat-containing protein, partial [Pseudomonadota bacterium]
MSRILGPLGAATLCVAAWQVAHATERPVADPGELAEALSAAEAGDRLILAPGAYGALVLKNRIFETPITIEAADPAAPPRFSSILLQDVTGAGLSDIVVEYGPTAAPRTSYAVIVQRSETIDFSAVEIRSADDAEPFNDASAFSIRDSGNVSVAASSIHDVYRGASVLESNDVIFRDNQFTHVASDGIVGGGVRRVTIVDNLFTDFIVPTDAGIHPDAIQFWDRGAARENRDIVIRGNVILRGAGDFSQGIFIKSPTLTTRNVSIEHNVVHQSAVQGVYLEGVESVSVRHNTIAPFAPADDRSGIEVRAPASDAVVSENLAATYRIASGVAQSGNVVLEYDNPWQAEFAGRWIASPYSGADASAADLSPLSEVGAGDFVSAAGRVGAPLIAAAPTLNPQRMNFSLVGADAAAPADWFFTGSEGAESVGDAFTPSTEASFETPGLWRVRADVHDFGVGEFSVIKPAERLVRVFPDVQLDMTFPDDIAQSAPEPAIFEGAPAAFNASPGGGAALFNGLHPDDGGVFLQTEDAAAFSGSPSLHISMRISRSQAAGGWERLVSLPGAYEIRMSGDRLRFLVRNADGVYAIADSYVSGLTDGVWHDVDVFYNGVNDGGAGQLKIVIDGVVKATKAAPGGLIAYQKTQTLFIGGVPWAPTFSGQIERISIRR